MISYGVEHGVEPKQHESTWLRNFTWLQFTTTIANAVYCFAFVLLLMWLLHRERTIFQVGTVNNYSLRRNSCDTLVLHV
jgi:hypothetical protein